jgi:hypothetical protein
MGSCEQGAVGLVCNHVVVITHFPVFNGNISQGEGDLVTTLFGESGIF